MIPTKPEVPLSEALALLQRTLGGPIDDLATVDDGLIAQTLSFRVNGEPYFLQFNQANMAQARRTEALFERQFRALGIPLRDVVGHGSYGDYPYTVSRKVRGVPLTALSDAAFRTVIPALIETMLALSRVEPGETTGFGWLDAEGNGAFASWPEHLLGIRNEVPGDFYDDWHRLFASSFLERDRFERTYAAMEALLPHATSQRCLVHSDLGYGNVFVEGGRVTALLDWQNCRWGDPVFDLAVVTFWREASLAEELVRAYLGAAPNALEHFDQRLECSLRYLALDALRFSARTDNRELYDHVVTILARIEARQHHGERRDE